MAAIEQYTGMVILFFLMSMICERIADFLKHYFGEANNPISRRLRNIFGIGNLLDKAPLNSKEEDKRYYRILKLNIIVGFFLALFLHADLFSIIKNHEDPSKALSWDNVCLILGIPAAGNKTDQNFFLFLLGCVCTGAFISFGSKFWHDMLDLLLEVKNYRRIMADPETYKVDKVSTLLTMTQTYQSDFIRLAYQDAKDQFLAMDNVKAVSLKRDNDNLFYFELSVTQPVPVLPASYQHVLSNGTPQTIAIKIKVLTAGDEIRAHLIDLSEKVFDPLFPDEWGTLGCLTMSNDPNITDRYILTCCHNVVVPVSIAPKLTPLQHQASSGGQGLAGIGSVLKAIQDKDVDAALIKVDPSKFSQIANSLPGGIPKPTRTRKLLNENVDKQKLFIYGAKSKKQEGVLTSAYSTVKIKYKGVDSEQEMTDLLAISSNGKAISQPGDSGSLLMDDDFNLVGMLVAGNETTSYAMPIDRIFNRLKVQLI